MLFQDRTQAGKLLVSKLQSFSKTKNVLVLAIPRGGVVIGKELTTALNCPLEVVITKKIGAPHNPELAIGALGTLGEPVIDEKLVLETGADEQYLKSQISNLKAEIERREAFFRQNRPPLNLKDKTVVITDDGVATGATMQAAVETVRQQNPKKIIVAVPVIAKDSLKKLQSLADEVIYLEAPEMFFSVGQFYQNFPQIGDEEVVKLLE